MKFLSGNEAMLWYALFQCNKIMPSNIDKFLIFRMNSIIQRDTKKDACTSFFVTLTLAVNSRHTRNAICLFATETTVSFLYNDNRVLAFRMKLARFVSSWPQVTFWCCIEAKTPSVWASLVDGTLGGLDNFKRTLPDCG